MPTLNFPTLSRAASRTPYSQGYIVDPTIRDEAQDGRTDTRDSGKVRRRWFRILYQALSLSSDLDTITTFESDSANFGANAFNYVHAHLSETVVVKFGDLIKITGSNVPDCFDLEIYLIESPEDFE